MPSPTCVTAPNLVVPGQTYERNYGDPPKNLTLRVPPYKVTHSKSLELTRIEIDWLYHEFRLVIHRTIVHVTVGLSRTVSETNGDFGQKSQTFPTPCN